MLEKITEFPALLMLRAGLGARCIAAICVVVNVKRRLVKRRGEYRLTGLHSNVCIALLLIGNHGESHASDINDAVLLQSHAE